MDHPSPTADVYLQDRRPCSRNESSLDHPSPPLISACVLAVLQIAKVLFPETVGYWVIYCLTVG